MCECVCCNVERICFPVVLFFMLLYLCRFSRDLLVHIMLQMARGKRQAANQQQKQRHTPLAWKFVNKIVVQIKIK